MALNTELLEQSFEQVKNREPDFTALFYAYLFADYPAGTFIHDPIDSSHIPQLETGCTLFVSHPEG